MTVSFFLRIMFAEEHQLGFDPSMEPIEDGQFNITVGFEGKKPVRYQTLEMLSDLGADSLFGRGTRVWKARRLDGDDMVGPEVALKDVWVDDDRDREGEIYCDLLKAGMPTKYLLDVLHHGDVYLSAAKAYDHSRILGVRTTHIPRFGPSKAMEFLKSHARNALKAVGVYMNPRLTVPIDLSPGPRIHYRLVLGGVLTPLYRLKKITDIFAALAESCLGMLRSTIFY